MKKSGMLESIRIIKNYILKMDVSVGEEEERLKVLRAIGTIEALLSFQSVVLNGIVKETEGLLKDINGNESEVNLYNQDKIYG